MAHLLNNSLDGAIEEVTPMLTMSPEFRIATVTGWLADLDRSRSGHRYATSRTASGLRRRSASSPPTRYDNTPGRPDDHAARPDDQPLAVHDREEPGPGQGDVYWHMLMNDHPQVVDLARDIQQRLAQFPGLHMTPLERLHMTALLAGPADQFSQDQLQQMIKITSAMLAETSAITVTVGGILYHPEAIMLAVKPRRALASIHDAVQAATQAVTASHNTDSDPAPWIAELTSP